MDLSPVVVEQVVPVGPDAAFTGFTRDLGAWWDPRLTPDPATYTGVDLAPEIGGEVAMRHGGWTPDNGHRRATFGEWGLLLGRYARHVGGAG